MSNSVMSSLESLSEYLNELSHASGEISLRSLDEQVIMVTQKAVGVQYPIETVCYSTENTKKSL